MDNEGRVFTSYSCKGNNVKEHSVLANSVRDRQDPKPGGRVGICVLFYTVQAGIEEETKLS